MHRTILLATLMCLWLGEGQAAEVKELFQRAVELAQRGDRTRALELATQVIQADDKFGQAYSLRGRLYASAGEPARALADFDRALELMPDQTELYQWRGGEQFKLGKIEASISDFDRFLEAVPERDPHHWQRGISYYYAGRFEEGRRQFERHQKVNSHDVENAVWHFICLAKVEGVEKARAELIPIEGDPRIPMMKIHELFAGRATAEEVLETAQSGEAPAAEKHQRVFYAHLYLGLYYDALGDLDKARQHILMATGKYAVANYMGDVARVHAQQLAKRNP